MCPLEQEIYLAFTLGLTLTLAVGLWFEATELTL